MICLLIIFYKFRKIPSFPNSTLHFFFSFYSKTGSPSKKKLAKNKNDPPEEENSKQFKTTDESFEEENSELETENESSEEENRVVLECSKPKDVPDYPKNSTMMYNINYIFLLILMPGYLLFDFYFQQ